MWRMTLYFELGNSTWTESHYLPQALSYGAAYSAAQAVCAKRVFLMAPNVTIAAVRLENLLVTRTAYYLAAGDFANVGIFNNPLVYAGTDALSAPAFSAVKIAVKGLAGYSAEIYTGAFPQGLQGTGGQSSQNLEPGTVWRAQLTNYLNTLRDYGLAFRVRQLVAPLPVVTGPPTQPAQALGLIAVQFANALTFGAWPAYGTNPPSVVLKGFRRGNTRLPGLGGIYALAGNSPGLQQGAATPFIYYLQGSQNVTPSNIIKTGGGCGLTWYYNLYNSFDARGVTHRKRGASARRLVGDRGPAQSALVFSLRDVGRYAIYLLPNAYRSQGWGPGAQDVDSLVQGARRGEKAARRVCYLQHRVGRLLCASGRRHRGDRSSQNLGQGPSQWISGPMLSGRFGVVRDGQSARIRFDPTSSDESVPMRNRRQFARGQLSRSFVGRGLQLLVQSVQQFLVVVVFVVLVVPFFVVLFVFCRIVAVVLSWGPVLLLPRSRRLRAVRPRALPLRAVQPQRWGRRPRSRLPRPVRPAPVRAGAARLRPRRPRRHRLRRRRPRRRRRRHRRPPPVEGVRPPAAPRRRRRPLLPRAALSRRPARPGRPVRPARRDRQAPRADPLAAQAARAIANRVRPAKVGWRIPNTGSRWPG